MRTFKKTICIEEFISRIPGLFPYLEFNEFGIPVKHKATDSIDGCYGKIIPDLRINEEKIPYRSLMRDYYEGELDPEKDKDKIETVMKGIGRIDILKNHLQWVILIMRLLNHRHWCRSLFMPLKRNRCCLNCTI